ncbi:MAG: Rieske 2Fe-2S domain-containing protein [Chloroflexi bacterium]|nr:Rieske 2Fe-2S domain-containing protein [Chloroflexota bacterium]
MSNWHLEPADRPRALTGPALRALRAGTPSGGISRRQLLRRSIGGAIALWLIELGAGTLGFLWPNLSGGFGGKVKIGDINDVNSQMDVEGTSLRDGAPAHFLVARAFVMLVDPGRYQFIPGDDPHGDGATTNVRTLYQRCTHLGCTPNFCPKNFWFECPCHGSRYDRLGIKVGGAAYGPAPRSLDRFASTVDANGVLTLDTGKITLGPLPVALGQPGVIPPRSPVGCL